MVTGDFEVNDIGTWKEIQLSRKLANAIAENPNVPANVLEAYYDLKKHYEWQIENGIQ